MKKLAITLILSITLFLSACSPEYDFSSLNDLRESAIEKAEYEGFEEIEARGLWAVYALHIMQKTPDSFSYGGEEALLEAFKADMKGKKFKNLEINGKTLNELRD